MGAVHWIYELNRRIVAKKNGAREQKYVNKSKIYVSWDSFMCRTFEIIDFCT